MRDDPGRREMLRRGGRWLPAAGATALLAPALTPDRAEAGTTGTHPLTGTWMTEVTVAGSGRPPEKGMFSFGRDGLVSGTDASRVTGFGTWKATGARTFAIVYRHYVVSNDEIGGIVVVEMTGTVTSSTAFTETGTAKFVDPGGTVVLTHEATATGTRFGFGPWELGG
ncbi:hypothetical protein [Actinomadura roseirufa]|uniref:hypothetical protein n=1 Tax=Actinomadura roseirufa TaxID=2094049 RepID=UPI00104136AD|nr:hypothetical protein [Actinomadura roseirufa]